MITSTNNAKIKNIIVLRNKAKARKEAGLFLVEGSRMFSEVPENMLREIYVTKEFLDKTIALAEKKDSKAKAIYEKLKSRPFEIVSEEVFAKMSDTVTPQGILCLVKCFRYDRNDLLAGDAPFLLVLEDIQDPGNLGTMLRTAEGAGVTGIILSRGTVDIYNPKVIRSTMGSIFRMPFVYEEDLVACLEEMKKKDIRVYAAALDGAEEYTKSDFRGKTALLIGNEGNGLSREAIASSTQAIYIKMAGKVESLNASISAAILLYHAASQREC